MRIVVHVPVRKKRIDSHADREMCVSEMELEGNQHTTQNTSKPTIVFDLQTNETQFGGDHWKARKNDIRVEGHAMFVCRDS